MAKKGILVLMLLSLVILVGCEDAGPRFNEAWFQDRSSWEDGAGNSFEYFEDDGEVRIDIHYMLDTNNYPCYIDEFTYINGKIVGTYSYHDPLDSNQLKGEFKVTMSFSYANEKLSITFSEAHTEGILKGVTMDLERSS